MKKIAITGVSKGLGYALAVKLCEMDHDVFGCARSEVTGPFHSDVVDVCDEEAVLRWADKIGGMDILVNNASIINRRVPVGELSREEFARVIEVNLVAVYGCIRAFLPKMHKGGIIVNVSSGWGKVGFEGLSPYCASKFGIEGMTQSIAMELNGVGMVSLDPGGGLKTQMLASCLPEAHASARTPEAWAEVAAPLILGLNTNDNGASITCP
ncbi:MAG: SDR family oxidoreductase [Simkaniaceae bacterium]|nr:SDR family oxidoreductase [Simkaniaceae bacterium]